MEGQRYPGSNQANRNVRSGVPDQRHHQGSYEHGNYPHKMYQQYSAQSSYGNPYNDWYNPAFRQGPSNGQSNQWHMYANSYNYQNRKSLSCKPCNRTFYSQQKLDEHLKDHVECPFPECKLSAHIKIIDQHISHQHMLVNFAALQIDDETWIAERKKRFPSAQRGELRRAQQMEKLKRGEKLGISCKPFDKKKGNRDTNYKRKRDSSQQRTHKNQEEISKDSSTVNKEDKRTEEKSIRPQSSRHAKRFKRERPPPRPRPTIDVDLYESDEEVLGVSRFKGTRQFYESTGEVNYFSLNRVNEKVLDHDIVISDDEEWEIGKHEDSKKAEESKNTETLVLGGALGSLMGAYSDSEEETEKSEMPVSDVKSEVVSSTPVQRVESTKKSLEQEKLENQSKDDKNKRFRFKRKARPHNRGGKKPNNFIKAPRRRKTLLEKLLQADIIHERNVILQCVRFVVENNFFDDIRVGSQEKKGEMKGNEDETSLVVSREVNETESTFDPQKDSELSGIKMDHSKTEQKNEVINSSKNQEKSNCCNEETNLVLDKEKLNETEHTSESKEESEICEIKSDQSETELRDGIANSSESQCKSNLVLKKENVNNANSIELNKDGVVSETELKKGTANININQDKSNLVSNKENVNSANSISEFKEESVVSKADYDDVKSESEKELTSE